VILLSAKKYSAASLKSDIKHGKVVNELKSSDELSKLAKKWNLE
jgi:hypothetical protein